MASAIVATQTKGAHKPMSINTNFGDLFGIIIPPSAIHGKQVPPQYAGTIEEARELFDKIQRAMTGEKKTNATKRVPAFIGKHLGPNGEWNGPTWNVNTYFPDPWKLINTPANWPEGMGFYEPQGYGVVLDGESRTFGVENFIKQHPHLAKYALAIPVTATCYAGSPEVEDAPDLFVNLNAFAVKMSVGLLLDRQSGDPYTAIAKYAFEYNGLELSDGRQKGVGFVTTLVAARSFIGTMVHGMKAVQYGSRPIPEEDIDFAELRDAATELVADLVTVAGKANIDAGTTVLSIPAVLIGIGAAFGGVYVTGDDSDRLAIKGILGSVNWHAGAHWFGAGARPGATGNVVGAGAKEGGSAAYAALIDPGHPQYHAIRHHVTQGLPAA